MQQCVAGADREQSEVVIEEKRAGVDAPGPKIIVRVPLDVASRIQGNSQSRNHWRQPAFVSEERDSSQVHGAGEHIAPARNQRTAECGIEKILLCQFPCHNFASFWTLLAWTRDIRLGSLPWNAAGRRRCADDQ